MIWDRIIFIRIITIKANLNLELIKFYIIKELILLITRMNNYKKFDILNKLNRKKIYHLNPYYLFFIFN